MVEIKKELDFPCPECGSEVEYYDTAKDGRSGRYRCPSCGRDTVWAQAKGYSIFEVMDRMKKKIEEAAELCL